MNPGFLVALATGVLVLVFALGCSDTAPRSAPRHGASKRDGTKESVTERPAHSRAMKDGLVETLPSVFGKALVFDQGPWRCIAINSRSSVQSCVHRRRPLDFRYEYVELLMTGALAANTPKRGVLLGLGGAGIAHLLRAHDPALMLDVVEIDPAVVTLAARHFRYTPRQGERAFVEDAAEFVARAEMKARYDLVFVDCFGESFIPPGLLTDAFFLGVRGLVAPNGVVVANLWSSHPEYPAIVKKYKKMYPKVWVLEGSISGNSIVIAGSQEAVADPGTLFRRARQLDARRVLPFLVAPHTLRLRAH